jgi:predicted nucleic acid-binding protein
VILVDTSVWIEHLRRGGARLVPLLDAGVVATHPFVVGEIALGRITHREETISMLSRIPQAPMATPNEVLHLIEQHRLAGSGIGYVDLHLIAAAQLMGHAPLWTFDKKLAAVAARLRLAYQVPR